MNRILLLVVIIICLSNQTFSQIPNYVPTNGLIGWWPFTGNANDENNSGNNGIVNGPVLTEDRNGVQNQAYLFDGIDDQIIIPDAPSLRLLNTDFTFNTWILPLDHGYHHIWYKGRSAGNDSLKYLFGWESDKFSYHLNGPGLSSGIWAYSETMANSNWQMGTIVKSIDTIKFYINGVFINQKIVNTPVSNTTNYDVLIGSNEPEPIFPASGWWNGKIDDIGLWNRALNDAEIQGLYYGTPTSINENRAKVNLVIYPNPTENSISIISDINNEEIIYRILNSKGQIVFNTKTYGTLNVDLSNLTTSGIYLVQRINTNGTIECSRKIILK
ncbi:MAG: LamG-like jellyroll fold domain-containing protein [Candidatus Saccharimonadaceae bacterium]